MAERELDPGITEVPIRYDQWNGALPSLFASHRYYMVGKLMQQGEDRKRAKLLCRCHDEEVKVFGPSVSQAIYKAYCWHDGPEFIAEAGTMEALWEAVAAAEE